jgi:hypothetical protein
MNALLIGRILHANSMPGLNVRVAVVELVCKLKLCSMVIPLKICFIRRYFCARTCEIKLKILNIKINDNQVINWL